MTYLLRRLPLSRLLLLCGLVVAIGISLTALAFALGTGPTPPPKPLADAIHDALAGADGNQIQGVSANIQLTDHLLEGASLASGSGGGAGQLSSSPLLTGAAGRLWIAKEGRVRLELQSEKGDTEIYYDGHTVSIYDASSNTLYRYTPPAHEAGTGDGSAAGDDPAQGDSAAASGHDHPRTPDRREDRRSDLPASASTQTSPAPRRPTSPARPPTRCASPPRKAAACSAAPSSPGTPPTACRCARRSTPRRAPPRRSNWRPPRSPTAPSKPRCSNSRRRRTPRSRKSRSRTKDGSEAGQSAQEGERPT